MTSSICLNVTKIIRHSVLRHHSRFITTASQPAGNFKTDISAYASVSHAVTPLNSYGLLKITGKDASSFLQGLLTTDITNASQLNTYNAILTPTGRYLYDCFVSQHNDEYLLETDINSVPSLLQTLKKYKLRAKVKFENVSDTYRVWSVLTAPKSIDAAYRQMIDKYANAQRLCYIDPRYNALGIRIILHQNEIPHLISDAFQCVGEDFYNALKCVYGIPTHGMDLIAEKSIILESNFNYINGVSFSKGCYVGQELIARTHHRGQIRKRLFGATIVSKEEAVNTVKHINNKDSDRVTIFPNNADVKSIEDECTNNNIIDTQSNKVVGKITSQATGLNSCVVQLRNTAFVETNGDLMTAGLQIQDSDYSIIPHYNDYFTSVSDLFAGKE